MAVHESLQSCTRAIEATRLVPTNGDLQAALGQVVLVDGPGFEDNDISQHTDILAAARGWLTTKLVLTLHWYTPY
jgi:hypothetical protein